MPSLKISKSFVFSLIILSVLGLIFLTPMEVLAQGHDHSGHGGTHGANVSQSAPTPAIYSVRATLREIDSPNARIVVDHGPIEAVGWGPMTMGFKVDDPSLLEGLTIGDNLRLDIKFNSPNDYVVVDLEPLD
ncbi:MAG: copper-binding protein [Deltaproteobacteria bacterium]|jgi:Cu/Ag efflux protein CusF|nr:copper-binding protein [Deltaproteobacteria bacterium]